MADEPLPPSSDTGDPDFERQIQILREVIARRSEALREFAMAKTITDEDRDLLAQLAKR